MYHNNRDFADNGQARRIAVAVAEANGECMDCYRTTMPACKACREAARQRAMARRAERRAVIQAKQGA